MTLLSAVPATKLTVVIALVVLLVATAIIVVATAIFLRSCYRRVKPGHLLVTYGKVGAGRSAVWIRHGGTFVWPLIQDSAHLDLSPVRVPTPALSGLPSTIEVGVQDDPARAVEHWLGIDQHVREERVSQILSEQLATGASGSALRQAVETELESVGLTLLDA